MITSSNFLYYDIILILVAHMQDMIYNRNMTTGKNIHSVKKESVHESFTYNFVTSQSNISSQNEYTRF